MPYQVTRNGQTYGPYTLEDLQRYVASGNILPSDLAKSEDMPDSLPVSQILGTTGVVNPTPMAGYPAPVAYTAPAIPYPDPPNLNWALVVLIDFFTCGLFQMVWNLILASWVKKVAPHSKAIILYIIAYVLLLGNVGSSVGNVMAAMRHQVIHPNYLASLVGLAAWVVKLVARFMMRDDLERHFNGPEPLRIRINPILTFFFGGVYFQYKLNQVNEIKQSLRYRGNY